MLCSWVNQLYRLGHFPVRFLYVYQAEYIMGLKKVRIMGIWHPPWKVTKAKVTQKRHRWRCRKHLTRCQWEVWQVHNYFWLYSYIRMILVYVCMNFNLCLYLYIHVYKERERDKWRDRVRREILYPVWHIYIYMHILYIYTYIYIYTAAETSYTYVIIHNSTLLLYIILHNYTYTCTHARY